MQKIIFILCVLLFSVSLSAGCASLQRDFRSVIACDQDPDCVAYRNNISSSAAGVAHVVAVSNPVSAPFDPFIVAIVSGISSTLAAFAYGKKKGRKEVK